MKILLLAAKEVLNMMSSGKASDKISSKWYFCFSVVTQATYEEDVIYSDLSNDEHHQLQEIMRSGLSRLCNSSNIHDSNEGL